MSDSVLKDLVKKILEGPHEHEWTLQGLGMLRLYLSDERRLHIWDTQFAVDNVSEMHTHPWDFSSIVVAGRVRNHKFVEHPEGRLNVKHSDVATYFKQQIQCGTGGGLIGEPTKIVLLALPAATYGAGDTYEEEAQEIHVSRPLDGTVTIVDRNFLEDKDHAYVYWKEGDWVSAEPRKASYEEVETITQHSLNTWFV